MPPFLPGTIECQGQARAQLVAKTFCSITGETPLGDQLFAAGRLGEPKHEPIDKFILSAPP